MNQVGEPDYLGSPDCLTRILGLRTEDPRTEDLRTEDPRIKDPVHGLEFCPPNYF